MDKEVTDYTDNREKEHAEYIESFASMQQLQKKWT